jgi:hypothetical protein
VEVDDLRVLNAKVQCANKAERPDWANFSQLGDFSPYWVIFRLIGRIIFFGQFLRNK